MSDITLKDFPITRELNGPIPEDTSAATVEGVGEVPQDLNNEGVGIRWLKSPIRIQSDGAIVGTFCHYQAENESAIASKPTASAFP